MMKKNFIFPVFLLVVTLNLNAQELNTKIGKVTEDELNMKYYVKDSTANALIMFEKGFSYFSYDNNLKRFKLTFQEEIKIKFFNKEGFEYADFKIPLYKSASDNLAEEITSVKGSTYNLENGKIVKSKVERSDVRIEETSINWDQAKFTFPNVKEGSIIELRYEISSYFAFNLRTWQFQYDIPVQYSEYTSLIPEFFNYHRNMRGYDLVNINEKSINKKETFTIEYRSLPQAGGVVESGSWELPSNSTQYTWVASDIPAFKTEAYITTEDDYVSILEFELSSIAFPQEPIEVFTDNWNAVNKQLFESDEFGRQLKISELIQKTGDEITVGLTNKSEMLMKIYNYVQNNIEWNDRLSKYIDLPSSYTYLGQNSKSALEKVISNKKGNSADINLLLLMLLKSKQIQCNPIILSTRDNGKIFPTHPTLSRFNYVIVEAVIDDKIYYLDGTSETMPLGMLPERCLNGTGRRVFSGVISEISIIPQADYNITSTNSILIDSEEGLSGTVNNNYKGYAAFDIRNEIIEAGGEDQYIKQKTEENSNNEISEYKFEGISTINEPLKESFTLATTDNITYAGDMIYLNPLLNYTINENPFKLEERKYPVDYAYKRSYKYIMQYTIPEGYEVVEFPENANLALPEKAASFQFQVTTTGNMIQVLSHLKINQPVILYDMYPALKNFYNLVIEKQNQKIVLKRKG
jgi:hypothetical protein